MRTCITGPVMMKGLYLYFGTVLENLEKCNQKNLKKSNSEKFRKNLIFYPTSIFEGIYKKLRDGIKNPTNLK